VCARLHHVLRNVRPPGWKQPDDGPAKLSTIPRIMDIQASRGSGPQGIFENYMPKYAIFGTFSLLHGRYIVHYTQGTSSTKCQCTK